MNYLQVTSQNSKTSSTAHKPLAKFPGQFEPSYSSQLANRVASGSMRNFSSIQNSPVQHFSTPQSQLNPIHLSHLASKQHPTVKAFNGLIPSQLTRLPEKRNTFASNEEHKHLKGGPVVLKPERSPSGFSKGPSIFPEYGTESPINSNIGNHNKIRMSRVESTGAMHTTKNVYGHQEIGPDTSPYSMVPGHIVANKGKHSPSSQALTSSPVIRSMKMKGSNSEAKLTTASSINGPFTPSNLQFPTYVHSSAKTQSTHSQGSDLSLSGTNFKKPTWTPKGSSTPTGNNLQSSRFSSKKNGKVKAYGANTNQGLVRGYNEDRVSIVLSITKPPEYQDTKDLASSLFAVYDGHGGARCAEFLRDNFYQYLIRSPNFPKNPKGALRETCAESQCFCANVGDSRAILSVYNGRRTDPLSRDHKPCDPKEQKRILAGGGRTYSNSIPNPAYQKASNPNQNATSPASNPSPNVIMASGPTRVFPGRLSVSRSFGDIEAKHHKFGGNNKVVISEPEISEFSITKDHDFIFLGSDGIFDKLSNEDITLCVWNSVKKNLKDCNAKTVHELCGLAVEEVIKLAMAKNSLDNLTAVLVSLSGLNRFVKEHFGKPRKTTSTEPSHNV